MNRYRATLGRTGGYYRVIVNADTIEDAVKAAQSQAQAGFQVWGVIQLQDVAGPNAFDGMIE